MPKREITIKLSEIHIAEHPGADGLGYGRCRVDGELWPCKVSRELDRGAAVPVPPDPARDARVAARRAEDSRRASHALDRLLAAATREGARLYDTGWQDGYAASELHHNRHYAVSDPGYCGNRVAHVQHVWSDYGVGTECQGVRCECVPDVPPHVPGSVRRCVAYPAGSR
jgi:hypothetical protein